MFVHVESFISPFIKTSDFPFKIRVIHSQQYYCSNSNSEYFNIELSIDIEFFQQIYESKYVADFLQSKEYKNAEKLLDLSEDQDEFKKFLRGGSRNFHMKNPKDYFDLSCCFPFELGKVNQSELQLINDHDEYEDYFEIWLPERCNCPFLINLDCGNVITTLQCLMLLILSHKLKIELPKVPKDYILNLISSYDDTKYKYLIVGLINSAFDADDNGVVLKEIFGRLLHNLGKIRRIFSSKFFFLSGDYIANITQEGFALVYNANDGELLIKLLINKVCYSYIMIYSNKDPFKIKAIKEFETVMKYFTNSWALLEIERE
jgi:hypothetical protein